MKVPLSDAVEDIEEAAPSSPTPEEFVADSPLEEDGFEHSVPARRNNGWRAMRTLPSLLRGTL
jgi:hypothetical protein